MLKKKVWIYVMLSLLAIFLMITSVKTYGYPPENTFDRFGSITSLDDNWYTYENGDKKHVDILELGHNTQLYNDSTLTIYHDIPTNYGSSINTLVLHTENISFSVYMGADILYTADGKSGSFLFGKSPGSQWHYIKLPANLGTSDVLRIIVNSYYNNGSEQINEAYIGNGNVINRHLIRRDSFPFIICFTLFIFGLVLILADSLFKLIFKTKMYMTYAGLISIATAIWSVSQTFIPIFFVRSQQAVHVMALMLVMLIPLLLIVYSKHTLMLTRTKRIVDIAFWITSINFAVQIIIYLSGLLDLQQMHVMTQAVILFDGACLLCAVYESRKNHEQLIGWFSSTTVYTIGFICFLISVIIDVCLSHTMHLSDTSSGTRIGLLIFIISIVIADTMEILDLAKTVFISEATRRSAYIDALTGLGNRNSFEKALEFTDNNSKDYKTVAIVVFDINLLKHVNDNYGHQEGDKLIINCGRIIKNIFIDQCESFRIGGDEFATILRGNMSNIDIEDMIKRFTEATELYNKTAKEHLALHVAVGFSIMSRTRRESISDVFRTADRIMYENKTAMKMAR